MHSDRDIDMANLSVRLSATLQYCIETNAHIVKLFPLSGIGMNVVFFERYRCYKIARGTPSAGVLNTQGGENLRFSIEIAVYLGNGTR